MSTGQKEGEGLVHEIRKNTAKGNERPYREFLHTTYFDKGSWIAVTWDDLFKDLVGEMYVQAREGDSDGAHKYAATASIAAEYLTRHHDRRRAETLVIFVQVTMERLKFYVLHGKYEPHEFEKVEEAATALEHIYEYLNLLTKERERCESTPSRSSPASLAELLPTIDMNPGRTEPKLRRR